MSSGYTGPSGTVFAFNSYLSGDVRVWRTEPTTGEGVDQRVELNIPAEDLLAFVAEHLRRQQIARLENATHQTILGLTYHEWLVVSPTAREQYRKNVGACPDLRYPERHGQ